MGFVVEVLLWWAGEKLDRVPLVPCVVTTGNGRKSERHVPNGEPGIELDHWTQPLLASVFKHQCIDAARTKIAHGRRSLDNVRTHLMEKRVPFGSRLKPELVARLRIDDPASLPFVAKKRARR